MLLRGGNLILGTGEYLENADIRIADGHISEIGRALRTNGTEGTIDLSGRWVLPGLVDGHVHMALDPNLSLNQSSGYYSDQLATLQAVRNADELLRAGFTTVRDVGSMNGASIALRDAIGRGLIEGPRILTAGSFITMTGGHGWRYGVRADGEADCRRVAREQLFAGADLLKVMATGGVSDADSAGAPTYSEYTLAEIRAIVEEAQKKHRRTAAHCHGLEGIRTAVEAGIDSVEHGSFADRETLEFMAQRGTFLCICMRSTKLNASSAHVSDIVSSWAERVLSAQAAVCRQARECGVRLAFGTDAGTTTFPCGENGKEFPFFVEYGGYSAMETIMTATSTAAEMLGVNDRLGTLEEGKLADVTVWNRNPLSDIGVLGDPDSELSLVMKAGLTKINRL